MPTLLQCDNLLEPWRHLPREGCVAGVLVVPGESSAFFCLSELPFCVGAEFLIHHSLANSIVSSPTSWALARLVVPIMLSRFYSSISNFLILPYGQYLSVIFFLSIPKSLHMPQDLRLFDLTYSPSKAAPKECAGGKLYLILNCTTTDIENRPSSQSN
ncbi:hypothetical protein Tco_0209743 [Tanacetum coccineum]